MSMVHWVDWRYSGVILIKPAKYIFDKSCYLNLNLKFNIEQSPKTRFIEMEMFSLNSINRFLWKIQSHFLVFKIKFKPKIAIKLLHLIQPVHRLENR